MTWHFAPGRTIVLGTVLILALVALQPLALGLFPVGAPDSDPGIGTGTGDLTAGALSALVRDLNADGAVPSHARSVSPWCSCRSTRRMTTRRDACTRAPPTAPTRPPPWPAPPPAATSCCSDARDGAA